MLAGMGGAAAVGIGLESASPAAAAEADDTVVAIGEVGAPRLVRSATRLAGRIDQNGGAFLAYGYLNFARRLQEAELFSTRGDPCRSPRPTSRSMPRRRSATSAFELQDVLSTIAPDEGVPT